LKNLENGRQLGQIKDRNEQQGIKLRNSPFSYAASYWLKHAMDVPVGKNTTSLSKALWELVRDFFWDDSSTAFVEWLGVSPDFDGEWHCVPLPDRQGVQCDRCLFHFQGNHRAVSGLHIAASYGLSDILEWAHPEGLDFEVKSHEGRTPLMYAAWAGELNAAKALLSKGGVHINLTTCKDPNCDGRCATPGRTALVEAVLGHRAEVMRLLLKQPGIEVDYTVRVKIVATIFFRDGTRPC
jgi:hypothetical protein